MLFHFLMFLVWKKATVSLWHILGPLHIFNGTVLQMFQNKRTAANWFNVIKISTYYSRSIQTFPHTHTLNFDQHYIMYSSFNSPSVLNMKVGTASMGLSKRFFIL